MALIEATHLTKRFKVALKAPGLSGALRHLVRPHFEERTAVDSIDLTIEAGESVAYVGPNGAGKSTTIKMLAGILVPTSGTVMVRGLVPHRRRTENGRNIGVVFGQRTQLWGDLPVQESLRLLGDIYRVPAVTFTRNLADCIDVLDLAPLLARPARQLSLGQRMRCDLAATLLHSPSVLFLDEPNIGLDVAVKDRVREYVRHVNRDRGVTILLSSHDLTEIEEICDRLIMIDHGRIVVDGPLQDVKARFGGEWAIRLVLATGRPDAAAIAQAALLGLPSVRIEQPQPHQLDLFFDPHAVTTGAIASRVLPVLEVRDLQIKEPTVEATVRNLYAGSASQLSPAVSQVPPSPATT